MFIETRQGKGRSWLEGPRGRERASSGPSLPLRAWMLAAVAALVIVGYGARIYYLTVLRGPYFYELSENNYLFSRPISAPRGNMLTADGATIVVNQTRYNIQMSPLNLKPDEIRATVRQMADLLNRPDLIKKTEQVIKLRPKWKSMELASQLELGLVAPALERLYQLPGVLIEPEYSRYYPYERPMSHITGYVGALSPEQSKAYTDRGYLRTDLVGKQGAERQFEDLLRGKHGSEVLIRDAKGRPRSSWIEEPARRGADVSLTLNARLQNTAYRALGDRLGAVVALDPRDGSVLVMVSKPDYDPNHPTRGMGEGGGSSTYNRAIRGRYSPASTFKLITAAAGMEEGFSIDAEVNCPGNFHLPNVKKPFWCDVRWGHDSLDMTSAIQKSCNVFFYTWGNRLGMEKLMAMGSRFGFGRATEIDLMPPGVEFGGVLGNNRSSQVFRGNIIHMAIGQGSLVTTTPLQLANAYAAMGNGGNLWRPHLFREARTAEGELVARYEPKLLGKLGIKDWQREALVEGLRRVVGLRGGTAFAVGFPKNWDVAGKTGSAEVAGQALTNGWFVAFAPSVNPEICVAALVEGEGHGGSTAAPIVREVFQEFFNPTTGGEGAPGVAVGEVGSLGALGAADDSGEVGHPKPSKPPRAPTSLEPIKLEPIPPADGAEPKPPWSPLDAVEILPATNPAAEAAGEPGKPSGPTREPAGERAGALDAGPGMFGPR